MSELVNWAREIGEEETLQTLLTVPLKDLAERYFESEEIRGARSVPSMTRAIFPPWAARCPRRTSELASSGMTRKTMGSCAGAWAESPSLWLDRPKRMEHL